MARCERCNGCTSMWDTGRCPHCNHPGQDTRTPGQIEIDEADREEPEDES